MIDGNLLRPRCFYCRTLTVPGCEFAPGVHDLRHLRTRDHVFPRWMLDRWPDVFTDEMRTENTVWCCWGCNSDKGAMHPLAWAERLSPPAAARLRHRVSVLESMVGGVLTVPIYAAQNLDQPQLAAV
ncbi:MAG: hypothetical protein J0I48_02280 [Devosia sp.]|uniref:hypothetical protein n=1 Tax=Devosia sp. 66-22 TaxID=1895753 RepID=UPI000929B19B|nr:hypothetical protein [Devosia sp. 66-22]MBN9345017.1 hypothetical protein [Devosia sp.]OJX50300.1 MAG: hypothetical protein BGO81_04250 [Devosia sp. 66-22]